MDAMQLLASVIDSTTTEAARRFADAGIPVFPCVPGEKRPLTRHGFHDATANPAQVARWWHDWPDANIGMPTGSISGWEVVDVDVLIPQTTARIAGRGIDFQAELARRARSLPVQTAAVTRRVIRDRSSALPPLASFGVSTPQQDGPQHAGPGL